MIGIFDSGVGGLTALREIRSLAPKADICYLADRKNAPYGTKSRDELLGLVKNDILMLKSKGADKILIACCTASTVYSELSEEDKRICYPIILPTARAALDCSKSKRIGVIATSATVSSHAFKNSIKEINNNSYVYELSTQELVGLVEDGECDIYASRAAREKIKRILKPLKAENIDTLILGCTHFPHITKTISNFLSGIQLISCSREGARELYKSGISAGEGKTEFIFT